MEFIIEPVTWIIWLSSYLVGGIPFSYIFGRFLFGIDLREHGSGNLGASNALRILGKRWGFLSLLLDMAKGMLPVYVALQNWLDVNHVGVIQAGIFSILGHIFTPYLKFKGGKGIATSLGVFVILTPFSTSIAIVIFLIVVIVTGFISLGSMLAALSMPLTFFVFYGFYSRENLFYFLLFLAILIILTHRSNIKNIVQGRERKIYQIWN
jgi:glycerol-3-phosphate acyltransferase PlsY